MSLYLVHEPLIYYFCWFQNHLHTLNWPSNLSCDDDDTSCQHELNHFNHLRKMKPYGIAMILPIATVLACILYYGVEEPVRKYFK
jgi:peptidoglycan/LPS O-acetylase OafA/YrhL